MRIVERQDSGGSAPISRYEENISTSELARAMDAEWAFLLRMSLFGTEESFGLEGVPVRLSSSARPVAESVREAGRALDSSKKGGYQQSVESKVNEFAKHRCYWFVVVAV